jgi:hypothetical protein
MCCPNRGAWAWKDFRTPKLYIGVLPEFQINEPLYLVIKIIKKNKMILIAIYFSRISTIQTTLIVEEFQP